uniref:SRCR domain-containing protein n=1 Tax=Steinernema glaseri TaxID=37863 RepID=A0A1I7Y2E0_9BILA
MLGLLLVYVLFPIALFGYYIGFTADCVHEFSARRNGTTWISGEFNLTCLNGKITVVNCVTEAGSIIPLGSHGVQVEGVEYSCLDDYTVIESSGEGSGEESSGEEPFLRKEKPAILEEADVDCEQQTQYLKEHFLVSCRTNNVIACVDVSGDILTGGYFLLENYALKFCRIYKNGRRARIENKGCFNGTEDDDVEDATFHIPKYAVWRSGDFDLRCGDNGIQVYRCIVDGKEVYSGTAWLDSDDVLNICK